MTIREFNNLEEIEKYYSSNTNTYFFQENGDLIDLVVFHFDLNVASSIYAKDIDAFDIKAINIYARDIKAWDIIVSRFIKARNINYFAICVAYEKIECSYIKGRRNFAKHFVLERTLEVQEND